MWNSVFHRQKNNNRSYYNGLTLSMELNIFSRNDERDLTDAILFVTIHSMLDSDVTSYFIFFTDQEFYGVYN